jgi:hypothetical protein
MKKYRDFKKSNGSLTRSKTTISDHILSHMNTIQIVRPYFSKIDFILYFHLWLSLGVKREGREADHSPPSIAEVKE